MHIVYSAVLVALTSFSVATPTPNPAPKNEDCKTNFEKDMQPFNKIGDAGLTPTSISCNVPSPNIGNATTNNVNHYIGHLAPKRNYVGFSYSMGAQDYCLGYIPSGSCEQVACDNGGGVKVCNDNANKLQVVVQDISDIVTDINAKCGDPSANALKVTKWGHAYSGSEQAKAWAFNGQAWMEGGWNVILGSASC